MPRGRRVHRRGAGRRRTAGAPPAFGLPGAEEMAQWKAADDTRQQRDAVRAFQEAERQPWERRADDEGPRERDRERAPLATPPPMETPGAPPPTVWGTPEPRRSGAPPPQVPQFNPMDLPEGHPWRSQYLQEQRSRFLADQFRAQIMPAQVIPDALSSSPALFAPGVRSDLPWNDYPLPSERQHFSGWGWRDWSSPGAPPYVPPPSLDPYFYTVGQGQGSF
jgi:hypothetical protein